MTLLQGGKPCKKVDADYSERVDADLMHVQSGRRLLGQEKNLGNADEAMKEASKVDQNSWHRHRHTCVCSYGTKRISQLQGAVGKLSQARGDSVGFSARPHLMG